MKPGAAPLRLVLDTNVWLDWLVFKDAALEPIKHAQTTGRIEICIDDACERELAAVLAYDLGKHTLDVNSREVKLTEYKRIACPHPSPPPLRRGGGKDELPALPKCSDPDDQKFLELARACGADYLVTKDKALLVLARRKTRPPPCRIVTPVEFGRVLSG